MSVEQIEKIKTQGNHPKEEI